MTDPLEEYEVELLADDLSEAIRDAIWGVVLVFENQHDDVTIQHLSAEMGWAFGPDWREADFHIEVDLETREEREARAKEYGDDS